MIFATDSNRRLITAEELGELLQKKERTIREMCYKGQIPYYRVGRSIRFNLDDVMEWLNKECRRSSRPSSTRNTREATAEAISTITMAQSDRALTGESDS